MMMPTASLWSRMWKGSGAKADITVDIDRRRRGGGDVGSLLLVLDGCEGR